jgi:hypothetical protein
MRFTVLGEVRVERDGDAVALGGPQQRRLLALLLSGRGQVVSTDRIAACRVAGRNLTREEWATNIGTLAPYRTTCPDLPTDG